MPEKRRRAICLVLPQAATLRQLYRLGASAVPLGHLGELAGAGGAPAAAAPGAAWLGGIFHVPHARAPRQHRHVARHPPGGRPAGS